MRNTQIVTDINEWKIGKREQREMAFDETDILGGKAIILMNDFGIWQFRMWVSGEKKYVRQSLKTKDKTDAISKAEQKVFEIGYRVNNGDKIFGISVEDAVEQFLAEQKKRLSKGEIVKGRYETISTHLRHFVRYIGGKIKANEITKTTLTHYTIDGVETNYVCFRKDDEVSDSTIRNELSTIGMCFGWLTGTGQTNVHRLNLPFTDKNKYDIDNNLIRRQTFTANEYNAFTHAFKSYVATKKNSLSDAELLDRQIVRDYLLIQANSGMRSGELRQLLWKNVEFLNVTNGNKQELVARINVDKDTSKVRMGRTLMSISALYFQRLQKNTKRKEGLIFSRDGVKELHNSFFYKGFGKVMQLSTIDKARKKELVPYSLRHFYITKAFSQGMKFEQIAIQCGTSIKQIEKTYLHVDEQMLANIAMSRFETTQHKYEIRSRE